jgi:hypothetical protein
MNYMTPSTVPLPEVKAEKPEDNKVALPVLNTTPEQSVLANSGTFNHAQRVAQMLSSSDLVPASYKGNVQNTLIALEMANRVGVSPLAVTVEPPHHPRQALLVFFLHHLRDQLFQAVLPVAVQDGWIG